MKLVIEGQPEIPLIGVKAALFDRDEIIADDFLAQGVTDAQGEIQFKFDSDDYTDAEDGPSSAPRVSYPICMSSFITPRERRFTIPARKPWRTSCRFALQSPSADLWLWSMHCCRHH